MPFREGHEALPEEIAICTDIATSINARTPYALSALGFSGQALLVLPPHLRGRSETHERAITLTLLQHTERQSGLFFSSKHGLDRYVSTFESSIQSMDALAAAPGMWSSALTPMLDPRTKLCPLDAIDSRGAAANHPLQALLNSLSGRRVLLITTPAEFLATRATKETFEAVWASIERQWFEPESIRTLEIPNTYSVSVRGQFTDSNHYLEYVLGLVPRDGFDVALIGAALYGSPIAAHVRSLGKVGISLGSQLQLLFGVYGQRWMKWPDFVTETLNEAWTLFPPSYAPPDDQHSGDDRSYWA